MLHHIEALFCQAHKAATSVMLSQAHKAAMIEAEEALEDSTVRVRGKS